MGSMYVCPEDECESAIVLVNSGGVYRDILCKRHNEPMEIRDTVSVEWDITEGGYTLSE